MKRILVVSYGRFDYTKLAQPGQVLDCQTIDRIWVSYDKELTAGVIGGKDIRTYDGVYMPSWVADRAVSQFMALLLDEAGVPFSPKSALLHKSKLSDMFHYVRAGLPHPRTFYVPREYPNEMMTWGRSLHFGYPVITKHVFGSKGKYNYRVNSHKDALLKMLQYCPLKSGYLVQETIKSNSDYRIVVIGGKPVFAVQRIRKNDETHTNFISDGAECVIRPIESIPELCDLAVRSAVATGREDYSGVDLIVDERTKKPYILEANANPSMDDMHQESKIGPVFKHLAGMIARRKK